MPFDAPAPPSSLPAEAVPRRDWTRTEVEALFDLPFAELLFRAATVHRAHFDATEVQLSRLLSIKTGGCAEDCGYCSQSARFDTGLKATRLMDVDAVLATAARAKASGAQRFCMGAAWRSPKDRDMPALEAMIAGVKAMGLETCVTLGMLRADQARRLADAGLDFYNHNLDTAPEDYARVVSTRSYADRLQTLEHVRAAGVAVCCGGIVGMGEARSARAGLIHAMAVLPEHPQSAPINALVPIAGTPLGESAALDPLEFVRTVAVTRLCLPRAVVRLAAGREAMSRETQALCFLAGANSIFVGAALLTTPLPGEDADADLLATLGMRPMGASAAAAPAAVQGVANG